MTRYRPGEKLMQLLKEKEEQLRQSLREVERKRQQARDTVTGKTRAKAYVRKWLEKLDTPELRREAEIRGFVWQQFESIEEAIDTIHAAVFVGVVICGETMTFQPVSRRDAPEHAETSQTALPRGLLSALPDPEEGYILKKTPTQRRQIMKPGLECLEVEPFPQSPPSASPEHDPAQMEMYLADVPRDAHPDNV